MTDAHMSKDRFEAQRGNDAWQNDVVEWPHQRLKCSGPSSIGEPCDEEVMRHRQYR